jgi:hypothetical protein
MTVLPDKEKGDGCWNQVLEQVAGTIPPGYFDTWFPPLRLVSFQNGLLHLAVPNQTFRRAFRVHCVDALRRAAATVVGSEVTLQLSLDRPPQHDRSTLATAEPFSVVRAAKLEAAQRRPLWLVERLWSHQAVGVIGGSPKSGKTTLAIDLAVSVASGTPCLGAFPVHSPGPVLLYAAEDSSPALRTRLETLARLRHLDFETLEVLIITADSLRLDRSDHQQRLEATLSAHRPALVVLDPLIRLHMIDENVAGQVAALLGYLRTLQRKTSAAIALVHHVRKNVSSNAGAGYSLRGSSDLYAWLDSFLYLRKHHGELALSAEHRSASPFGPIPLELLQSDSSAACLRMASTQTSVSTPDTLADRILGLLTASTEPLTADSLRNRLQVRNQRVVQTLRKLQSEGRIQRLPRGYVSSPEIGSQPQLSM